MENYLKNGIDINLQILIQHLNQAAEQICISYENTYKVPLMIVNVMNAFGERQHVEKFIPLCIKKLLNNEKIYIHSYPDKKLQELDLYTW